MISKEALRVESIQLSPSKELKDLCHKCKNVYNLGNFYIKQFYRFMGRAEYLHELPEDVRDHFKMVLERKTMKWREKFKEWRNGKRKNAPPRPSRYMNRYDAKWILKYTDAYKELPSQISQNVLKTLHEMWKSFFQSLKDWKKNSSKYKGRPNPPNYLKKEGEYIAGFNYRSINKKKLLSRDRMKRTLYFPKKILKPIEIVSSIDEIRHVRIVPKLDVYNLEIVYDHVEELDLGLNEERMIGIDLGVNNLACVVNNIGLQPFAVNGRPLKSMNHYYNKRRGFLSREISKRMMDKWKKAYGGKKYKKNGTLTKRFVKYTQRQARKELKDTKRMKQLTRVRNNKVRDYMHKASRYIINYCIEHDIGTIVIGKNEGWKQKINIGKRNNQNFVQIPFNQFIEKIQYKGESIGIKIVLTTEEYTSQTCCRCGVVNPANRVYRGLYVCSTCGIKVNADVNGAYNILKKAFPKALNADGIKGAQLHPSVVNLNSKSRLIP